MKKVFLVLVGVILSISLIACETKKADEVKVVEQQVEETVAADTTVVDTTQSEAPTPTE